MKSKLTPLVAVCLLAACGSGGDDTATTSPSGTTTNTAGGSAGTVSDSAFIKEALDAANAVRAQARTCGQTSFAPSNTVSWSPRSTMGTSTAAGVGACGK